MEIIILLTLEITHSDPLLILESSLHYQFCLQQKFNTTSMSAYTYVCACIQMCIKYERGETCMLACVCGWQMLQYIVSTRNRQTKYATLSLKLYLLYFCNHVKYSQTLMKLHCRYKTNDGLSKNQYQRQIIQVIFSQIVPLPTPFEKKKQTIA